VIVGDADIPYAGSGAREVATQIDEDR